MKADINRNNPCFRQNIKFHFWRIWSVPSTLYVFLVWQGLRYLFRIASTVNKVQGFDFFCMNQKLQSCFGFQNKRNILWFKYSLTTNSSELIIIIHLCICFKLAQISQFEVSQANKPKCMNFVFRHTIWANPKYLIHMSYCWRVSCFCRYSVRLTLSRGWTKSSVIFLSVFTEA